MGLKLSALVIAALVLTGCSGGGQPRPRCAPITGPPWSTSPPSAGCRVGIDLSYPGSHLEKVEDIAALLPDSITRRGRLRISSEIGGAPAAFQIMEQAAPVGYEIDLANALGRVLGVEIEIVPTAPEDMLNAVGRSSDVGISSLPITPARQREANLLTYITVGASFGSRASKRHQFDPDRLCGRRVGVPAASWYFDDATAKAAQCASAGQEALTVIPYRTTPDLLAAVLREEVDLSYADSSVTQYGVLLTSGAIAPVGSPRGVTPRAIVVSRDDPGLTEAIQRALQHLMDSEEWRIMATSWGVEGSIVTKAEVNPFR